MKSESAFSVLADESFDFIFIDGNHAYDYAFPDILHSIRKLREGGTLAGHDCEEYPKYNHPRLLECSKNDQYTKTRGIYDYHCGVIKALGDIFDQKFIIFPGSITLNKSIEFEHKKKAQKLLQKARYPSNNAEGETGAQPISNRKNVFAGFVKGRKEDDGQPTTGESRNSLLEQEG